MTLIDTPPATATDPDRRVTLRDLRQWARDAKTFAATTCYDATTARLLYRAGLRVMLAGDTAAQMILGYDSTLPASMPFMLEITAAVRRGAPNALVMADMPFGSYQCGQDEALKNATDFLSIGHADLVKMEVDETYGKLVERMSHAGVPIVAHIGSRPQTVRYTGGFHSTGRTKRVAELLVETAEIMIHAGAVCILIEAVPDAVSAQVVERAVQPDSGRPVPVIGCGAGPSCHGHIVVLHDLLGLSDWQPPFAKPMADLGRQIEDTAARWVQRVESGQYLADGGPYTIE